MGRGAEAYLQMWERAEGVPGPDCRSTHARFTGSGLGEIRLGASPKRLLRRAGQPEKRERTWKWCVDGRGNDDAIAAAVFTPGGEVALAGTSARGHRARGVTVGADASKLGKRADRAGGGLWTGELGGATLVYGERGGRVDFIAVAEGEAAKSDRSLRRYVRLSGL
jgi:hypothetical protein